MIDDTFFDGHAPVVTARAPGRLDVMGGIADYSGSLVLQLPTRAEVTASAQWDVATPPVVTVRTADPLAAGGAASVSLALASLQGPYADVRARFARTPGIRWAAYVAGAITVLHHDVGLVFDRGIRLHIASTVPAGRGVSSSAALEVAAMRALLTLAGRSLAGRDIALLSQKVENLVVGAPCGVMDQMTAACGARDQLLALLCQPAELEPPVDVPVGIEFLGIDSGIRHDVAGAGYESVRVGAFMGYRIVADLAGLVGRPGDRDGVWQVDDPRWYGYLANLTPAEWDSTFRDRVPERMTGATFLARFGGTTDAATRVDPGREYVVRQATAHPIHEHDRVQRFRALLEQGIADDRTLAELGDLMYASHESYSACGLGTAGTDRLVDLVKEAGPAAGLFGARITGGGSGGTVAVIGWPGCRPALERITARYADETGRPAALID